MLQSVKKMLKGSTIKKLYLVRHGKSDWKDGSLRDFQRGLSKQGEKDIITIGSYLALKGFSVDAVISSAALRAQLTTDGLAEKIGFDGTIEYMDELYLTSPEMYMNVLSLQDNQYESILVVGHNPVLSEIANILQKENFTKFPTVGMLAINLEIDSWEEIGNISPGEIDFFIFPKQFKYYMPGQIRASLK